MMKNAISLLIVCLLLQSCTSFQKVALDEKSFKIGEKYKIKQGGKYFKGKLKAIGESEFTFGSIGKEKTIALSDMEELKQRKFSLVKTAIIVPISLALAVIITYGLGPDMNTVEEEIEAPN